MPSKLVAELKEIYQHVNDDSDGMKQKMTSLETVVADLRSSQQQSVTELQKVNEEKEKARRLVDELEDQLYTTYNQHQATSSRLSMLNSSRDQALQDANAVNAKLEEDLDNQRARVAHLEVSFGFSLLSISLSTCGSGTRLTSENPPKIGSTYYFTTHQRSYVP